MRRLTILHVTNIDRHFQKHLLPAVRAQIAAGHAVHIAAAATDPAVAELIRAAGVTFHPLPYQRSSIMPWQILREWLATARLLRRLRPDMVRTSTWKPLAAVGTMRRFAPACNISYAIPGLGYMFLNHTLKAILAREATLLLLARIARRLQTRFEVLNADDQHWLHSIIGESAPIDLLPGLGVDTSHYAPLPLPPAPPYIFVLPGRLLWDKGIRELAEAARLLKAQNAPVRIALAGHIDPDNLRGIPQGQLDAWQQEGILEYWGYADDIRTIWARAHACILPSYREGLSMALIEAAACARPIICTDVSGCRETVRDGQSGFLVPVKDAAAIADAVMRYVRQPELLAAHGEAGRQYMLARFDVALVQKLFLQRAEQFS